MCIHIYICVHTRTHESAEKKQQQFYREAVHCSPLYLQTTSKQSLVLRYLNTTVYLGVLHSEMIGSTQVDPRSPENWRVRAPARWRWLCMLRYRTLSVICFLAVGSLAKQRQIKTLLRANEWVVGTRKCSRRCVCWLEERKALWKQTPISRTCIYIAFPLRYVAFPLRYMAFPLRWARVSLPALHDSVFRERCLLFFHPQVPPK